MISPKNLDNLLRTARKHRVSKITFSENEVTGFEFFAPNQLNAWRKAGELVDSIKSPAAMTNGEANIPISMKEILDEMPSDEEFKFYHSSIAPSSEPPSQEEQRKAS